MIEPELAFADLEDDMACATAYLQYVVCYLPIFCPQFNINIRITLYSVRLAIFAACFFMGIFYSNNCFLHEGEIYS